jgi:hypothetical protein
MLKYQEDRRHFYYQDDVLTSSNKISDIPDDVDDYWSMSDAVQHLAHSGCLGSDFSISGAKESLKLCAEVVKIAVAEYGENFSRLYRGSHNGINPTNRVVKYATPSQEVAEFYGAVTILENIKGLRTFSLREEVLYFD